MKIGGVGRLSENKSTSRKGGPKAAPGFTLDGGPAQAAGPAASAGTSSVASVSALMALQGEGGERERETRRRALARATELLDLLDEVRAGLLSGGIPRGKLEALLRLIESQDGAELEPGLKQAIGDIELRVRVELAKYEKSL